MGIQKDFDTSQEVRRQLDTKLQRLKLNAASATASMTAESNDTMKLMNQYMEQTKVVQKTLDEAAATVR